MYILLSKEKSVAEIIPDENPVFPGVPIEERYAPDFVQRLLHVPNGTEVQPNWVYDAAAGAFSPPEEQDSEEQEEV